MNMNEDTFHWLGLLIAIVWWFVGDETLALMILTVTIWVRVA